MSRLIKLVILSSFVFHSLAVKAEVKSSFTTQAPLYIVSDINGDLSRLETSLKTIGLIDSDGNWIGEDAHFISLGDIINADYDKQPSTRKIIDLLMKLQVQAEQQGGKVHVLLGDREIYQLQGHWGTLTAKRIEQFSDLYPQLNGISAYQQAFSLTGQYGKWLAGLPFVIKVNDQLFTHGGISKWIEHSELNTLNTSLKAELISNINAWHSLSKKDSLTYNTAISERLTTVNALAESSNKTAFLSSQDSLAITRMGPAMYHGNQLCHPYFEKDLLREKLSNWKASRLWIGHSMASDNNVKKRFTNRLMLIDTSNINTSTEGNSWVAKLTPDGETHFIDGVTGENTRAVDINNRQLKNVYHMNVKEIEDFLRTATITKKESTKEGRTKPFKITLERDGKILHGIFKYKDSHPFAHQGNWSRSKNYSDRYQYEVVAYKLDRLLGIGLVPITVLRKIDGKSGIIQLWIDGLVSQLQFNEKQMDFTGYCDPKDQMNMMNAFDYLILNTDRNQTNILYSKKDWQVWFIDHSKSFGTSKRRQRALKKYDIKASPTFKKALQLLNNKNLSEFKPWLHRKQIQSLLMRRDNILADDF